MSEETTTNEAVQNTEKKRNTILTVLSFIFLLAGGIWILSLFFDFSRYETTNTANKTNKLPIVEARTIP